MHRVPLVPLAHPSQSFTSFDLPIHRHARQKCRHWGTKIWDIQNTTANKTNSLKLLGTERWRQPMKMLCINYKARSAEIEKHLFMLVHDPNMGFSNTCLNMISSKKCTNLEERHKQALEWDIGPVSLSKWDLLVQQLILVQYILQHLKASLHSPV